MKFLSDVHISYKLVNFLSKAGHKSIQVNNILKGSYTKDKDICEFADHNGFIVISKDLDFKSSFFINKTPNKLIKVNLGNISNKKLVEIFKNNIVFIDKLNRYSRFIIEVDEHDLSFVIPD